MTSHDVVSHTRRVLRTKKVGHAGTLDPLATGVLVICIGKATRLSGYLTAQTKRYTTRIQLGVETDSLDADGQVVAESDAIPDKLEDISSVLDGFRGEIEQVPPMFSAKKVDGRRLHRIAREGETVEREPVTIAIHRLEALAYDPPFLDLDVTCSKGTYIRSLAADIGSALGCGGSVVALRRTRSGQIDQEACVPLDQLDPDRVEQQVVDPVQALSEMPSCTLDSDGLGKFANGNRVSVDIVSSEVHKVLGEDRKLWGLGREDGGWLQPVCVLREAAAPSGTRPA